MKPYFRASLLFLLFVASPLISEAGEIQIEFEVFSLTKVRAARLLSDERLVVNPAAVLKDLGEMKERNEAALIETPSLQGVLPLNTQARGKISVEVDVGDGGNGATDLNIFVQTGTSGAVSNLRSAFRVHKGVPKFVGTLEPLDAAEKGNTWMVFLHVQQK